MHASASFLERSPCALKAYCDKIREWISLMGHMQSSHDQATHLCQEQPQLNGLLVAGTCICSSLIFRVGSLGKVLGATAGTVFEVGQTHCTRSEIQQAVQTIVD
jgi:hypothetical protein